MSDLRLIEAAIEAYGNLCESQGAEDYLLTTDGDAREAAKAAIYKAMFRAFRSNEPAITSNDGPKTLTEVVGATGIEPVTPPV